MATILYCDSCKKEIPEGKDWWALSIDLRYKDSGHGRSGDITICYSCKEGVLTDSTVGWFKYYKWVREKIWRKK